MKFITFLFTVFFWFNAVAVAPYGIKGQSQSGTLYSNVHQFPNNQVTNMGGINALVETGNKNILVNPSFEHSTFSTGWTSGAGSFSQNLTVEIDGLKAAEVTLSAQALAITQDSTLYAAQFADGVQGLASVRVKTSLSGIRVCSRQASVTSTTNCVNVQGNGKWGLYKVPMILGATSNGISINSNGTSLTGTVYLDDAFVGAVDLQATVDSSRVAGEAYFAGTASCVWSRTSTTVGAFTTSATCPGPTIVTSTMGSWQTTDSDLPRVTINNLPAGTYKAKFIVREFTSVATNQPVLAINDGTTTCEPISVNESNISAVSQIVECTFVYTNSGNRVFELYGASPSNTITVANLATAPRASTKFILEYFGSGSVYSSTNADTDWASCQFSTLVWSGLGTVTNNLMCKRDGSDLLMRGTFVAGSTVNSQAQVPLPIWNGVQLSSKALSVVSDYGRLVRSIGSASSNKDNIALGSTSSLQYFTIGIVEYASTAAPLTSQNGNALFSVGEPISAELRIPIEGWQQSNIIIGQFNGLESCTNTLDCTDTFSAKISSAGVVSDENVNWINGNASIVGTSVYNITFNTGLFTTTPNCVATPNAASGHPIARIEGTPTSSGVSVYISSSTANFPSNFSILCQKQGADYIGKTAKAVASDQNVRSIGSTGMDLQSVYFGSGANCGSVCSTGNCNICNQVGSKITSVSFVSTGVYNVNGIDGTKYFCSGTGDNGTGVTPIRTIKGVSTSSFVRVENANFATLGNAANASINCVGIP